MHFATNSPFQAPLSDVLGSSLGDPLRDPLSLSEPLRQFSRIEICNFVGWSQEQCACGGASPEKYPLVMHALHQESLIFHRVWPFLVQSFHATCPTSFHRFGPIAPESLIITGFSYSDAKSPNFCHILALLHQQSLGISLF